MSPTPARTARLCLLLLTALPASAVADDELEISVEADPPAVPSPAPASPPAPAPALAAPASALPVPAGQAPLAAANAPLFEVHGYVQAQYQTSQLSEDEVTPDGYPRNLDRFVLRRARVTLYREWDHASVRLQPDFNTVEGPWLSLNNATFSVFLPNPTEGAPPYAELTAGVFDTPFGYELLQSNGRRPFMERTQGSRAFFVGDQDVGAQLSGGLGPLRWIVAAVNGVPFRNGPGEVLVYSGTPTLVGRFGAEAGGKDAWEASGGASLLRGKGFHAGDTGTKSSLDWLDTNQNGTVTLDELVGTNGQAPSASATFDRWAAGADLQLGAHTRLGWTRVYLEATMASNLDRNYLPADPVATGYDLREVAWGASIVQEATPYALLGFRADGYDPNSDAFETRRGDFIPTDVSVLTLSPILAARWPGVGQLIVQYDYIVDQLGRDVLGEPRDLPNDQWTVRGQVGF